MGASMCGQLIKAGFSATVTTRTREKAEPLLKQGASWSETPHAVAENSDVIFSIVGFPSDVKEVLLGERGALSGSSAGDILVDMTTSSPSLAVEISGAAEKVGVLALDAPVSGGAIGAEQARLSIMVGGDRGAFDSLRPCFEAMGQTIEYQGPAGCGQNTKLVNQTLIASNMIGVCEALLYAQQAGLDLEAVMRSVTTGAAGSWSLTNLGRKMIEADFEAGFFVEHFVKDLGLALTEAERMGLELPGLALAQRLYRSLESSGHGRSGTQALVMALAELSSVRWRAD